MHQQDSYQTQAGPLVVTPILHASFVMEWKGEAIYCDPIGGKARYEGLPEPTLIILTHHHDDHIDIETLEALVTDKTEIIAPQVAIEKLTPELVNRTNVMGNGETLRWHDVDIRAVPMYNTTPERAKFHEKGVGNGYVFDFAGTKVYLASDTEPTPEMEGLGPIDIAFFPMNLPYTMTPDQVLACIEKTRPQYVYPFHYRFPFDTPAREPAELAALLPADSGTRVVERDWYT